MFQFAQGFGKYSAGAAGSDIKFSANLNESSVFITESTAHPDDFFFFVRDGQ